MGGFLLWHYTMTPYKKAGIIKYVPSSGTYPTSGNWEIVDFESISRWVDNGVGITNAPPVKALLLIELKLPKLTTNDAVTLPVE